MLVLHGLTILDVLENLRGQKREHPVLESIRLQEDVWFEETGTLQKS